MKDSNVRKPDAGEEARPASVEKKNVSAFVREGDSAFSDAEVMAVSDTFFALASGSLDEAGLLEWIGKHQKG